jgi:branched-chain amino acid aminotransferase
LISITALPDRAFLLMGDHINYNGLLMASGQPVLQPDNRGFKFGDGIFETMRISKGRLLLANLHFARLSRSMELLRLTASPMFAPVSLETSILELCEANGQSAGARVRLTVFRNAIGSEDASFLIESSALEDRYAFYEKKLVAGIYPDARKSMDKFSRLKSCSYLPYSMAAQYARRQQWDDCFVLNSTGRICDASIANVFWTRDEKIFTPPLSEGCIAGVMREYLIGQLASSGYIITEATLEIAELLSADEVFLTNAIRGMRPVAAFESSSYHSSFTERLFKKLLEPLMRS